MPESSKNIIDKTGIIVISKTGKAKEVNVETNTIVGIRELTELLSKKCGNTKSSGFSCYHTYRFRNKRSNILGQSNKEDVPKNIYVDVWGKTDGRAGDENKYELPPPIDDILFFGNIALVSRIDKEVTCNLTLDRWDIIYEKLFGGFEDLSATAKEDENEIDELDMVPASKKTKNGYLKDDFVVEDDLSTSSGGGSKRKNRVTSESEFETETETETETESTLNSNELESELEPDIEDERVNEVVLNEKKNIKVKDNTEVGATSAKPKGKSKGKAKNVKLEDIAKESEDELVEDEYD
jgi:hypothetical protein